MRFSFIFALLATLTGCAQVNQSAQQASQTTYQAAVNETSQDVYNAIVDAGSPQ